MKLCFSYKKILIVMPSLGDNLCKNVAFQQLPHYICLENLTACKNTREKL